MIIKEENYTINSNRCPKYMAAALDSLGNALKDKYPGGVNICYVDCPTSVDLNPSEHFLKVIRRNIYSKVDDKGGNYKIAQEKNLTDILPVTCFSVEEAKEHSNVDIWFSKNRYGAAGKDMECVRYGDLDSYKLPKDHILQEGVTDLLLRDGKKFTARIYALIWDGKFYLYKSGFMMIHGVPYDKNSTDYDVQINHHGFGEKGSLIEMDLIESCDGFENIWINVKTLCRRHMPILEELIENSSKSELIAIGIDCLINSNNEVIPIEVNAMPNFSHSEEINEKLNAPFFNSLIRVVLGFEDQDFTIIE